MLLLRLFFFLSQLLGIRKFFVLFGVKNKKKYTEEETKCEIKDTFKWLYFSVFTFNTELFPCRFVSFNIIHHLNKTLYFFCFWFRNTRIVSFSFFAANLNFTRTKFNGLSVFFESFSRFSGVLFIIYTDCVYVCLLWSSHSIAPFSMNHPEMNENHNTSIISIVKHWIDDTVKPQW